MWKGWMALSLTAVLAGSPFARAGAADQATPRGVDVTGRLGLGLSSSEAPLGVRYFWNRRSGMEAAVGFRSIDGPPGRRTDIVLDGAYLHALAPGEHVNFFLSPGVRFRSVDLGGEVTTTVRLGAALDVEVFLTDRFAVGARSGLFFETASPAGSAADRVDFGTTTGKWAAAGFHFYLDKGSAGL